MTSRQLERQEDIRNGIEKDYALFDGSGLLKLLYEFKGCKGGE